MQITLVVTKAIYRKAIDAWASDAEGPAWRSQVADEVHDVIDARILADDAAYDAMCERSNLASHQPRYANTIFAIFHSRPARRF